jgi:hypothetical protein
VHTFQEQRKSCDRNLGHSPSDARAILFSQQAVIKKESKLDHGVAHEPETAVRRLRQLHQAAFVQEQKDQHPRVLQEM